MSFQFSTRLITLDAPPPLAGLLPRRVDVWLPPGYDPARAAGYPVIYLHDGQNQFIPELSYTGIDWGVDEALTALAAEGRVPDTIAVAVWNSEQRWRDYLPAAPFADRPQSWIDDEPRLDGPIQSDLYLDYLVGRLKPRIDAQFNVDTSREHTWIMGSSMGGLISLYAVCRFPDVFAGAGCLSTHWPALDGGTVAYFREAIPLAGRHRLYFDYGTVGLDAAYAPYQAEVDAALTARGYRQGHDCLTRAFEGADHNEAAWRARVKLPLAFLLGGREMAL